MAHSTSTLESLRKKKAEEEEKRRKREKRRHRDRHVRWPSPGTSLDLKCNGVETGPSLDKSQLDDALKDLPPEASVAFKAHFQLEDGNPMIAEAQCKSHKLADLSRVPDPRDLTRACIPTLTDSAAPDCVIQVAHNARFNEGINVSTGREDIAGGGPPGALGTVTAIEPRAVPVADTTSSANTLTSID